MKKAKVKQPSQKRIEKVCRRSINSFVPVSPWILLPLSPFSCTTSFHFVFGAVIGEFFAPLYLRKIGIIRWPVKNVDHELDEKVPFRPDTVKCYMDFINIWIRPLNMLLKRYGWLEGSKLCAEFMRRLITVYDSALAIYRQSMTTTVRPPCDVKAVKKLRALLDNKKKTRNDCSWSRNTTRKLCLSLNTCVFSVVSLVELYNSVCCCKQAVISSQTNIVAREDFCSTLFYDD